MDYYRIYFQILSNVFNFFTLELFISYLSPDFILKRKFKIRCIFIPLLIVYSLIPDFSYNVFICYLFDLLFVFFSVNSKFYKKIFILLKYELYVKLAIIMITIFLLLLTNDLYINLNNELYSNYQTLLDFALIFIILNIYINYKKLKIIGIKTSYERSFNTIIILCVITLAIISMLLGSNLIEQEKAMPIAFSLVILIIFACLSVYHNIITSVENDAKQKIQIEKYELEDEYYKKIDDSLKSISSLRHDFKNHLIIIDGYANENKIDEIKKYVNKINSTLTQITIIKSESTLLSSILNTKKQDCLQANVAFEYNLDFCKINIDDFYLVTILGNILDNAITASSKVANGFISIIIRQLDSYLEIICSNSHCENLTKKDGFFITTKENPGPFHGIGLSNVVHTIEDIDGTINFKYDASTFSVDILLPNYN